MTLEIQRLLAFGALESEHDPPQPRVFRLGVGDDLVVALACDMIEHTSTEEAPWVLIEAENKEYGRIKVIHTVVRRLREAL